MMQKRVEGNTRWPFAIFFAKHIDPQTIMGQRVGNACSVDGVVQCGIFQWIAQGRRKKNTIKIYVLIMFIQDLFAIGVE